MAIGSGPFGQVFSFYIPAEQTPDFVGGPFNQLIWPAAVAVRFSPPFSDQMIWSLTAPFVPVDLSEPFVPRPAPVPAVPYNLNLYAAAIPFVQNNWPATKRVASTFALSDQAIWSLQSPFAQYDWSDPYRPLPSVARVEGRNIALTAPIVGNPFTQTDWPQVKGPRYFQPPTIDGALIDITQPFAQYDWSKPYFPPASVARVNDISIALLTAPPPADPFKFRDWPPAVRVRSLPGLSDQAIWALQSPFSQTDWSDPFFPRPSAPFLFVNIALATPVVTAPFSQTDWPRTYRFVTSAPSQVPLNVNLFTNPIPFGLNDFGKPVTIESVPAALQPNNLVLAAVVVQAPFGLDDWSIAVRVKTLVPDQIQRNPLIFSEVPFNNPDWSKPQTVDSVPLLTLSNNVNLLANPIPFAQYDWSKPQQSPIWQGAISSNFNVNLNVIPIAPPFVPIDWSKPFRVAGLPPGSGPVNINLFTNPVPFGQIDLSSSRGPQVTTSVSYPNFSLVNGVPFIPTDFSSSRNLSTTLPTIYPNLSLLNNPAPFTPIDLSFSYRPRLTPQNVQTFSPFNLALSVVPFVQSYWPAMARYRPAPQNQVGQNNLAIGPVNPIPFSQLHWPNTRSVGSFYPRMTLSLSVYAIGTFASNRITYAIAEQRVTFSTKETRVVKAPKEDI